ncbi:RidA family protein [Brevibacillus choshinensis]|uniref:RidA family protein n=1 Tax=Brevibacillus choshinensis TaxID=54911 RepID=A0ABX7FKH4_BRECH|nr:RidA family protein [Brevibacillus choshinensis]QRG66739.1 RidA family protein [Brevibacillus choshinensis]
MSNEKQVTVIHPETMPKGFGYSHVVEAIGGRTIYISGQVPLDREGRIVGEGDLAAQTKQVFENVKAALTAAEASFDDVVKLTFFVTDITQMQTVREIRDAYVNTENPPASSAVEVRKLIKEEFFIEIEAIAVANAR